MAPTPTVDRMTRRLQAADYRTWREQVERTGGCTHPVRMSGHHFITDKHSGDVLSAHRGQVMAPCGNRRESVCVACSDRYAADAFHLLRAGLSGGTKGIPEAVSDKPRLFVTLTAPSFGPVHNRPTTRTGKHRPCACGRWHHEHDPALGQPLDPETYDYTGHVLWQAHAGDLWSRFRTYLARHLARAAGITVRDFSKHARVSFAKVAEYQRRGLIHFHAVIRLDGPDGAVDSTPSWGSTEVLTDAVHAAHATSRLTSPDVNGHRWDLAWGAQIDVRPIKPANASHFEDEHGVITDDRLASYVAKYATKGTGKSEATDRPIRSEAHIDRLQVSQHHRRIIHTAWTLAAPVACPACHPHGEHQDEGCGCDPGHCETCSGGGLVSRTTSAQYLGQIEPDAVDPIDSLKLRRWAHMLAFRGHFLSKSRHYSVTFKNLREARSVFRHEAALDALGIEDPDSVLVVNHWDMTSVGHRDDDERELAAAIADNHRQTRKHRHHTERRD
ncbi:replication initiation protein [Allosaccharopolyspora coralli]|uniref:Replication initiation protein n=1 Tax=Allosaccharopolyspora coralli TaxID=2665642 RepID=A0A5Q3Q5Q8_9PSEU|nr:replication initiator [Allosaccharopolyspora coralli]QGK69160.1 replication initiation protein [Allosaccharopolyspora coralli]